MILRYRPDDGPEVEFDFKPGDMESPESEAVEAVGGEAWSTFEEWGALFFRGSQKARRAALWVFLRRTDPSLRFNQLSVRANQVDVDYSLTERNRLIEVMLADPTLDNDQRVALTRMVAGADVIELDRKATAAGVEVDHGDPKDQPLSSADDALTSPEQA